MPHYYVANFSLQQGIHEVHEKECARLPQPWERTPLGEFPSCHGAVIKARTMYPGSDGCPECSKPCQKRPRA